MRILVLCTGNSCRSQMAEGFLRRDLPQGSVVESAGLEPHGVNPLAVRAMDEVDVDLSNHTSDHLSQYLSEEFDFVITVCDNAAEQCPTFPGTATRIHWPIDDPAKAAGSEEEIMLEFRRVRDDIAERVSEWSRQFY